MYRTHAYGCLYPLESTMTLPMYKTQCSSFNTTQKFLSRLVSVSSSNFLRILTSKRPEEQNLVWFCPTQWVRHAESRTYSLFEAQLALVKPIYYEHSLFALSTRPTDAQVDESQRKFAKPEPAYGLAMGGQTDSQVGSQVHASRKFHAYTFWLAINLCRLALGGQTVKNVRRRTKELSRDRPKSTQVNASGWPNETQVERRSNTCIDLRVRLARALVVIISRG